MVTVYGCLEDAKNFGCTFESPLLINHRGQEMKMLSTFCPECDREVDARLERRTETLPVKGEPTSYDAEAAVCPCCGEAIGDSRVEEGNLRRAYSAYRVAHGLMAPDEVKGLRNSYGLSLRELPTSSALQGHHDP